MNSKILKDYRNRQSYLKSKIKSYEERRNNIGKLSASYEGEKVQTSRKNQDSEAEELAKLMDEIGKTIQEVREEGITELNEIHKILNKMDNVSFQRILSERYLEGKSPYQLAEEMDVDYRHIIKKTSLALKEFDRLCC